MARRQAIDWCLDGIVLATVTLYVFLAPYTKVEESFNIQASHDILHHGADLQKYDHKQFPGVVPRTFLGALAASAPAWVPAAMGASPLHLLYVVRMVIGAMLVASLARLRAAIDIQLGQAEARFFALIILSQFHLPFYMSRPLPNTFALAFACVAEAEALAGSGYRCLALLAVSAAIFRCDMLVLIAPMGLFLLFQRRVSFLAAAMITAAAAAGAAALSIAVDSVMWGRLLWPEFLVLWFNTGENKSSEWGTSPPLWYFYSALPRSLLGAAPLALAGCALEARVRGLAMVAVTFVALYSFLPHKELRFIFPALPLLNLAAAAGAGRLLRCKGTLRKVTMLAVIGLLAGSCLATTVFATASALNYAGGTAMVALHELEPTRDARTVHIGNLAAISGVSRFLEARPAWSYSKAEGLEPGEMFGLGFDWLLSELPEVRGYTCRAAAEGYDRVELRPSALRVSVLKKPLVYILARSSDGDVTVACNSSTRRFG